MLTKKSGGSQESWVLPVAVGIVRGIQPQFLRGKRPGPAPTQLERTTLDMESQYRSEMR